MPQIVIFFLYMLFKKYILKGQKKIPIIKYILCESKMYFSNTFWTINIYIENKPYNNPITPSSSSCFQSSFHCPMKTGVIETQNNTFI